MSNDHVQADKNVNEDNQNRNIINTFYTPPIQLPFKELQNQIERIIKQRDEDNVSQYDS